MIANALYHNFNLYYRCTYVCSSTANKHVLFCNVQWVPYESVCRLHRVCLVYLYWSSGKLFEIRLMAFHCFRTLHFVQVSRFATINFMINFNVYKIFSFWNFISCDYCATNNISRKRSKQSNVALKFLV